MGWISIWDHLEEITDMVNRYLVVMVDKASKFEFVYPLASKEAEHVAWNLLELILKFGGPLCLGSDPGMRFLIEVITPLFRWFNVTMDYAPVGQTKAHGTGERLGGWRHEILKEFYKAWPRGWDTYLRLALAL